MLNIQAEQIISFSEAASLLPRRRKGRKPHIATLYRWAQRGCRGVVLETVQVGGTRCTSREALQRFCDRLSAPEPGPSPRANTALDRRQADSARRELDAAGF